MLNQERSYTVISHKLLSKKQNQSAGQGLVEFSLTLPILMLILVGILDLGRLAATYVILTDAAREGARYGASTSANSTKIAQRIHGEVTGSLVDYTQMPAPVVTCSPDCSVGNSVQVQVTYPFTFITTYIFAGVSTMNISAQATFQIMQ